MASAESRDQSNLTSSDSGRTARFGDGSPAGEEAFAVPTLTEGSREENPAIEDSVEGPEFAESYVIAEAVMRSLESSLAASRVTGAAGSSEPEEVEMASAKGGFAAYRQKQSGNTIIERNREKRDQSRDVPIKTYHGCGY